MVSGVRVVVGVRVVCLRAGWLCRLRWRRWARRRRRPRRRRSRRSRLFAFFRSPQTEHRNPPPQARTGPTPTRTNKEEDPFAPRC